MRREIKIESIKETVRDLIYQCSFNLTENTIATFEKMKKNENSDLAKNTMDILLQNAEISKNGILPLCQDCGVVIVFLEIGENVVLIGEGLEKSINEAVESAYKDFNLRKSVVSDPLKRINSNTNTPAFIHYDIVEGDSFKVTVYLKGGGSENMTSLKMFRPTDSKNLILDYIEESVVEAGPNPCPPIFLGIGIGGTADLAMVNSKKAVIRLSPNPDPFYEKIEEEILRRINKTNIGPLGFGGVSTAGGVFILEAPTHIATLPVALNLNCHSLRLRSVEL